MLTVASGTVNNILGEAWVWCDGRPHHVRLYSSLWALTTPHGHARSRDLPRLSISLCTSIEGSDYFYHNTLILIVSKSITDSWGKFGNTLEARSCVTPPSHYPHYPITPPITPPFRGSTNHHGLAPLSLHSVLKGAFDLFYYSMYW